MRACLFPGQVLHALFGGIIGVGRLPDLMAAYKVMPPGADIAGHALIGHERLGGIVILGLEVRIDHAFLPEAVDIMRDLTTFLGIYPVGQAAVLIDLVNAGRRVVQAQEQKGRRKELFALEREGGKRVHLFTVVIGGMLFEDSLHSFIVALEAVGNGKPRLLEPVPADREVTAHHVRGIADAGGQLVEGAVFLTQQVDKIAVCIEHALAVFLEIRRQLDRALLVDEGVGHGIGHAHDQIRVVVGGQHHVQPLIGILAVDQLLDLDIEFFLEHAVDFRKALIFLSLAGRVVTAGIVGELQRLHRHFPAVLVHGARQFDLRHLRGGRIQAGHGKDQCQKQAQIPFGSHCDLSFYIIRGPRPQ